jgi:hypothetical protein
MENEKAINLVCAAHIREAARLQRIRANAPGAHPATIALADQLERLAGNQQAAAGECSAAEIAAAERVAASEMAQGMADEGMTDD